MANWEPQHPPRTSSRFPAPGIFVNVEFGVSFRDRPHTASMNYTSRRMQERLNRQRREQDELLLQERNHRHPFEQPLWSGPHPSTLTPGTGDEGYRRNRQQQRQQQQRSLGVRTREQHERGSSAPPSLSERPQMPTSPVSPIMSIQHTSSMPLDGYERPLPPLPSQYRLGEDSLPWSTEPWYRPASPDYVPPPATVGIERENWRGEDPQRVRELEDLHLAMLSVDSLPHDGWEAWTWESVGEMPRGPRSLGWAVSSNDTPEGNVRSPISPPPPYVVSQWESSWGWNRPRSSG
ncbi:uncharacterized protein LY89DRAFT_122074 [Mollisia scopiformis]|uniref:Uncharacterized protein n=1 Tax=Mollisia scopiformis TaxID=149040 RepID=A0A194X3K0_MOLSC|nr:uncharacterized protein LY89DRAFT_122074 [Mollisia scopiformis]KUJ14768.1 hypothetical protein LY89DRAFT_122074 [Mollisia scopiformis]